MGMMLAVKNETRKGTQAMGEISCKETHTYTHIVTQNKTQETF